MNKKIVGIAICILFCFSGISTANMTSILQTSNDDYAVKLTSVDEESYQFVDRGETAIFQVKIENLGTLDDTYDLTAGSVELIHCEINDIYADQLGPYEISLVHGGSDILEITAEVGETVQYSMYYVMVRANSQNDSSVSDLLKLELLVSPLANNNPPNPPTITGPSTGNIRDVITYEFTATDPDNNDVFYYIEFEDGAGYWTDDSYPSGEGIERGWRWTDQGTQIIRAKSKDIYGAESEFETFEVSLPRNKPLTNQWFRALLENWDFPILTRLLNL